MNDTVLKATARKGTIRQIRDSGSVPGVLHASDASSTPIQIEAAALSKAIAQHGANARVCVQMDKKKTNGFVKEVQRNPVDGKIIHVAIQLIQENETVKTQVAIAFHGRDELETRQLQLHVHKSEIEVSGKPDQVPNIVTVDVTGLNLNDSITQECFKLPKGVQLLDPAHEVYAIVKPSRRVPEAEPAAAPATPATPAT